MYSFSFVAIVHWINFLNQLAQQLKACVVDFFSPVDFHIPDRLFGMLNLLCENKLEVKGFL